MTPVRYEQQSFWRHPHSAFFTFVFPVVPITVFGALFHGGGGSSYLYGLSYTTWAGSSRST